MSKKSLRVTAFLLMCCSTPMPVSAAENPASQRAASSFAITTAAFHPGGAIPSTYTCDGKNVSPALSWMSPPSSTQSFALIAEDPDAPVGTFTHWVLWNIPAQSSSLPQGVAKADALSDGTRQGTNDFRRIGYDGPCPPPGKPHRYYFKLYALSIKLDLKPGASRKELQQAIRGHVLAETELMGTFGR